MTNGELVNMLINQAKKYTASGIEESVRRNAHMNKFGGDFDQALAEAVLVDFVNSVAANHCMDLGLYTVDLKS